MSPKPTRRLGMKIKQTREERGMTQAEVADKVGIHPMYVSRIERGVQVPSLSLLDKLARALKVEIKDLL
jgi:transcriptional regulator with XRE-family HTH domain